MIEIKGLDGRDLKGAMFDCYQTLIDIATDEDSISTYEPLSRWLIYQGVKIEPEDLRRVYKDTVSAHMNKSPEKYPDIRVEDVFKEICEAHAIWDLDATSVGVAAARTFRADSIRRLQAFPQSRRLLDIFESYPTALVSNGQRIFSEIELKFLGLHAYFDVIIYSSDEGRKKPDPRIFITAARKLRLQPEEIVFIGDSFDNDIAPAAKLGMRALHIDEAWKIFHLI